MKRIAELRDLSDDHHTGLVLAQRCVQAGRSAGGPSRDALWQHVRASFSSHLEPHFLIEERHLLPGLDAIGESALAERIRDEHLALRAFLEVETPGIETIRQFGELLRSHIRFEEREVFEPHQARLPGDALEAIVLACREIPRSAAPFPGA